MARFTEEQSKYGAAMELMINLYYQLKGMDPSLLKLGEKPTAWLSTPLVMSMAEIFHLSIPNFSPCMYFPEYSKFRYRGEGEEITITNGGILNFIEAMEALKSDVLQKKTACFKISEVITESHESPDKGAGDRSRWSMKAGRAFEGGLNCTIVPGPAIVRKAAEQDDIRDYQNKLHARLNNDPSSFDSFVLSHQDSQLFNFTIQNYDIYNVARSGWRIYSPGFSAKSISLTDAVIYLLIRYQYLFGSYERVKACKQCGNLFFEKRLGSREFCSGLCRKNYNDSLQMPAKRLCRERQNQWTIYKFKNIRGCPRPYRLQKDDCNKCDGVTASGKCPALMKKNPKAQKFLHKHDKKFLHKHDK